MVCQECLDKRERSQKLGFSQNKTNLNNNFLSLNAARKVGVNMHLEHKKFGFDPMSVKCNICKGRVEKDNLYCLQCAFLKGICESCGKRISDVKMYKQTDIDYKKLKKIKEADRQRQTLKKQEDKLDANYNTIKRRSISTNRSEKTSKGLKSQRIHPNFKLKKVEDREEDNNSQDEIDFSKNIEEVCNVKSQLKDSKAYQDLGKSTNRIVSDSSKKDKEEQNEVELDEDYTEVIKI